MTTFELLKKKMIEKKVIEPGVLRDVENNLSAFEGGLILKLLLLGLIDHDQFLKLLGPEYVISNFSLIQVENIPNEVIAKIPQDLATEFFALPLKFSDGVLTVGLPNPTDMRIIEELKFFLDCEINPVGVDFNTLIKGMEIHYGMDTSFLTTQKKPIEKKIAPEVSAEPIIPEIQAPDITPEVTKEPEPPKAPKDQDLIKDYEVRLQNPEKPDIIKKCLLEFTNRFFERIIIFVISQGKMAFWGSQGKGLKEDQVHRLQVPLNQSSIIERVYHTRSFYFGKMPDAPLNKSLLETIGETTPEEVLLIPIIAYNKVVGILYADSLIEKDKSPDTSPIQILCQFASKGFEKLLAQKKKKEKGEEG